MRDLFHPASGKLLAAPNKPLPRHVEVTRRRTSSTCPVTSPSTRPEPSSSNDKGTSRTPYAPSKPPHPWPRKARGNATSNVVPAAPIRPNRNQIRSRRYRPLRHGAAAVPTHELHVLCLRRDRGLEPPVRRAHGPNGHLGSDRPPGTQVRRSSRAHVQLLLVRRPALSERERARRSSDSCRPSVPITGSSSIMSRWVNSRQS
jgi:hypothetical protein